MTPRVFRQWGIHKHHSSFIFATCYLSKIISTNEWQWKIFRGHYTYPVTHIKTCRCSPRLEAFINMPSLFLCMLPVKNYVYKWMTLEVLRDWVAFTSTGGICKWPPVSLSSMLLLQSLVCKCRTLGSFQRLEGIHRHWGFSGCPKSMQASQRHLFVHRTLEKWHVVKWV